MSSNQEIHILTQPLRYGGETIPAGTRLTGVNAEGLITFSLSHSIENVANLQPIEVEIDGGVHLEIRRCSQ